MVYRRWLMSTTDTGDQRFCGQCGALLRPDKTCPNGHPTGTYVSRFSSQFAPTIPSALPVGQPRRIIVVFVVVVLISFFLGGVVFAWILQPGTSSNAPDNNPATSGSSVPSPTATLSSSPTPTLTPTPLPSPGTLLYQADWSKGLNGWKGSSDWKVADGVLLNDGTNSSIELEPTIIAPYQVRVPDYAVEANIQVLRGNLCFDAATIRGSSTEDGWHGYKATICDGQAEIKVDGDVIAQMDFDPGQNYHTYHFEAKGNLISLLIDGNKFVLKTNDNKYLSGGEVGLKSLNTELDISSFKIIAL